MSRFKKSIITIILIFIFLIGIQLLFNQVFAGQSFYDYTKLDNNKYPGVKSLIDQLKKDHPNYSFMIFDTGIDWEDMITMEYQGHYNNPRNFVQPADNRTGMWICPLCNDRAYDNGSWRCASVEAIEYMMDPRNSITIDSVFQFEELGGKDSNNYTISDIAAAVSGTFLDNDSIIQTIYNTCKANSGISSSLSDYLYDYDVYSALYPDLVKAFGNDKAKFKEHWRNNGIKEGRIASLVFDVKYYLDEYKDLKAAFKDDYKSAYEHFLRNGIYEFRKGSRIFDVQYYIDKYDDIYYAFANNPVESLKHFVDNGLQEGRIASNTFQLEVYQKYEDLKKACGNNAKAYAIHYLGFGIKENRIAKDDKYNTVQVNPDRKPVEEKQIEPDDEDMNPLYLVSLILSEQGRNGSTLSKGQGYQGQYVGYYNLLNIGAYGPTKDKVILNGLKKAQDNGWTSPEISIQEGITFLRSYYIGRGQTSLYTQKFDIVGEKLSDLFQHQYEQNVMGAEIEGRTLKKFYVDTNTLNSKHSFVIPVYNNMPKNTVPRPSNTDTHNHNFEIANVNVNSTISARSSNTPNYYIAGNLKKGEQVQILQRANEKFEGLYRDLVVNGAGVYGYVAREEDGKTYLQVVGSAHTDPIENPNEKRTNIESHLYDFNVYYNMYEDLRKAFGNDQAKFKEHWQKFGIREGRVASLVYDPLYYLEQYEDLRKAFGTNYQELYKHFINFGIYEGRKSSKVFDVTYYMNKYEDLQKAFGNRSFSYALNHFIDNGSKEFRIASDGFNVQVYKDKNADLQNAFKNNSKDYFVHFVAFGCKENRTFK